MNEINQNFNQINNQSNQQLYPVEYVHYLEQSVMDLTERILALEEEVKQLKQSVCFYSFLF